MLGRVGLGERITHERVCEDAVDDERLVVDAEVVQLGGRRGRDGERAGIWAGHQHDGGLRGVLECVDRSGIDRSMVLEATEGAETAGGVRVGTEVVRPGGRQAQEAKGVARRGGVEHDMVIGAERRRFSQETSEGIERRDLDRARAGQLLLQCVDLGIGQHTPVGINHTRPVLVSGHLGIDIHYVETIDRGDLGWFLVGRHLEDVAEIRCGISGDQQHPQAGIRERDRGGSGHGRLADTALARIQHEPGRPSRPVNLGEHTRHEHSEAVGCQPERRAPARRIRQT